MNIWHIVPHLPSSGYKTTFYADDLVIEFQILQNLKNAHHLEGVQEYFAQHSLCLQG